MLTNSHLLRKIPLFAVPLWHFTPLGGKHCKCPVVTEPKT